MDIVIMTFEFCFHKVMQNTKPGLLESHLHALLEFECRIHGAQRLSFPPVVAGGNRANTLHYVNNTHILRYEIMMGSIFT